MDTISFDNVAPTKAASVLADRSREQALRVVEAESCSAAGLRQRGAMDMGETNVEGTYAENQEKSIIPPIKNIRMTMLIKAVPAPAPTAKAIKMSFKLTL